MTDSGGPLLQLRGITKTFPGVRALDGVDFDVSRSEVHALVGENGAGKSTLLKVLSAVYPFGTYQGTLSIDGRPRQFRHTRDAETAGVAVVYQELSLVGPLTVAENICLGHEPARAGVIRRDAMCVVARAALDALHASIDVDVPVEQLGIGHQQLVEIAKALARDARMLVLDEPTAALSDKDADALLEMLRRLRQRGLAIVYVSHRLHEVSRLADRITVLRDGRTVGTGPAASFGEQSLIAAMVGREIGPSSARGRRSPDATGPAGSRLEVRHLSIEDPHRRGRLLVDDVSFDVRAGEVLGIAGLVGAGRSELLLALFGAAPGRRRGEVLLDGVSLRLGSPRDAIAYGLALLTEDRKTLGLLLAESVTTNIVLPSLARFAAGPVTRPAAERAAASDTIREYAIRPPTPDVSVGTLSGGNQQKVLLGRAILTQPKVLLLDEPTRGIDVGARQEIYAHIDRLASAGLAIVVVSSDLPEVLALADRLLVLREGRLSAVFDTPDASPDAVMAAATPTVD
jgi:D-xylose transport system ATP-binding protein